MPTLRNLEVSPRGDRGVSGRDEKTVLAIIVRNAH